jgi:hypothetical protein
MWFHGNAVEVCRRCAVDLPALYAGAMRSSASPDPNLSAARCWERATARYWLAVASDLAHNRKK